MADKKIHKGCSMLNAADETAKPYGLILSEVERGQLNALSNMTNALLYGRTGRKQQVRAALSAVGEVFGVGIVTFLSRSLETSIWLSVP